MSGPSDGGTRRADVVLGGAASAILLGMMLLTVVDVVGRYVFNRPVRGAFEVTELMLVVLIFAGLPLVSYGDEHAVMDFVDRLLGPAGQRALWRAVQVAVDQVLSKATLRDLLQNEEEMNTWVRSIPGPKGLLTIQ